MKKYQFCFPCYGQSVGGRIQYHQKMGVAQGITRMIKDLMRNRGLDVKKWETTVDLGNNISYQQLSITVGIPTPLDIHELMVSHEYPTFEYSGKRGYIDMLCYNGELQFHIVFYERDNETFANGGWHSIREGLNLEDTCLLFEYVDDRLEDIIIESPNNK